MLGRGKLYLLSLESARKRGVRSFYFHGMLNQPTEKVKRQLWLTVIAVSLGYAVDLYNLLLFGSIRKVSLAELGITGEAAGDYALNLMNWTVGGMAIGGFVWGALSDRYGRARILYWSIGTFIVANLGNAFVTDINSYKMCRLFAGFALAGELGTGMVLIAEKLPTNKRTLGGAIVTACGMLGAVLAGILSYFFAGQQILGFSGWRVLFVLGTLFGILVFVFRRRVLDANLFLETKKIHFLKTLGYLFSDIGRIRKFFFSFLIGAPVFFIIGILVTLSPEFGRQQGHPGIEASLATVACYFCISLSDFIGTLLSKYFKSRKKILLGFLFIQLVSITIYLYLPVPTAFLFYCKTALLGVSIGLWGTIVLFASENWGTNLRGTVTTAVPNLIRALLIPISYFLFEPLRKGNPMIFAAGIVSLILLVIAFYSLSRFRDTFENDLNFRE